MLAVLIVGVGLLGGCLIVLALVRHNLMSAAVNDAEQRAQDIAAQLATGATPQVPATAGKNRAAVQIVDRSGRVLAASPELQDLPGPVISQWPESGTIQETIRNASFGQSSEYLVVGISVAVAGQPAAVYSARSLEPVDDGVEAAGYALALLVPVLLAVVGGTSWLLVGRALRPVEAMRSQVAAITASGLNRRLSAPEVQDEVGRLANTMNGMLARLEQAHQRQRRFVGDAAHELRSPIATVLTQLEVGLAHPNETDWIRLAQDLHRESSRLDRLTDELLTLSRSEGDATRGRVEWVDLDELVLLEVEAVRARGKVTVELSPFSAARLRGSSDDLRGVVRNLLDNAERHAVSQVRVGLSTDEMVADLIVADDGQGIPETERERVFDRFFRLQPARDRDSGGAGLGLAIVRNVVLSHGGQVSVRDSPGGAEFHVRLPVDSTEPLETDG
ncbi:MAG: hypothetical protein QOE71_2481 [Pseudonocardiales bacterium]|nr:hypothetical protein [Pseudonocardiales bacterium]